MYDQDIEHVLSWRQQLVENDIEADDYDIEDEDEQELLALLEMETLEHGSDSEPYPGM